MEIKRVVKEIIRSAELEAEKRVREAEKRAEEIIREAEKRAEKLVASRLEKARRQEEERKNRELSLFRLRMKRELMKKKKEYVEKILEEIRSRFISLQGEERKRVLRALAKKAGSAWEVVYCNEKDKPVLKTLFRNTEIKTRKMSGGFIAGSRDGSVEMDMRFETVFENAKRELVKKLFG